MDVSAHYKFILVYTRLSTSYYVHVEVTVIPPADTVDWGVAREKVVPKGAAVLVVLWLAVEYEILNRWPDYLSYIK